MKKKVTDEEVGKVLGQVAEQVRSELDYEFRVAKSQMLLAENDLIETFTTEQKELYLIYSQKRTTFYDIAEQMYEKKF